VSAIDAVIDAAHARFAAAPALAATPIYDGPPVSAAADPEMILLGDDGDVESAAVSTYTQMWVDMACTRREEMGDVVCAVVVQSGDDDLDVVRSRATVLLAACSVVLAADMTMGGVVYSAVLDSGSARPLQNADGVGVIAPFTIRYRAQV
jgi:hypothetical protein